MTARFDFSSNFCFAQPTAVINRGCNRPIRIEGMVTLLIILDNSHPISVQTTATNAQNVGVLNKSFWKVIAARRGGIIQRFMQRVWTTAGRPWRHQRIPRVRSRSISYPGSSAHCLLLSSLPVSLGRCSSPDMTCTNIREMRCSTWASARRLMHSGKWSRCRNTCSCTPGSAACPGARSNSSSTSESFLRVVI